MIDRFWNVAFWIGVVLFFGMPFYLVGYLMGGVGF